MPGYHHAHKGHVKGSAVRKYSRPDPEIVPKNCIPLPGAGGNVEHNGEGNDEHVDAGLLQGPEDVSPVAM